MSYTLTIVDETWGESAMVGVQKTVADLPTAKSDLACWADRQVQHVRSFGLRPTVDVLPISQYPTSAVISWMEEDELIVTLVVVAVEDKD